MVSLLGPGRNRHTPLVQRHLGGRQKGIVMSTPVIGIDLGVTSASELAVAEGAAISSTVRTASNSKGLVHGIRKAAAGREVSLVLEGTAMAWFVAAVAAGRSGVAHKLYRVSGRKAAALRSFYRSHTKTDRIDARVLARMPLVDDGLREFSLPEPQQLALKRLVTLRHKLIKEATRIKGRIRSTLHWAAPGLLGKSSVNDGITALLTRWPDLRALARAKPATIKRVAGVSGERAEELRESARQAVSFYRGRVDFEALGLEFELATGQLQHLQAQQERLEERIATLHAESYPNDVLLSLPGVGPTVSGVVRAVIGDGSNFANLSSFRAYSGLVPRENSSGEAQRRGRISKAGPNPLRWALFLAADAARRNDPELAALYRRLMLERGHRHQQAVCAVASHLVSRIWAVIRQDRPYQYRDHHGNPLTREQAREIALELAIDPQTRQQLKNGKQQRGGPGAPRSRQPKAPQDNAQPSPQQLTEIALELAKGA